MQLVRKYVLENMFLFMCNLMDDEESAENDRIQLKRHNAMKTLRTFFCQFLFFAVRE